MRGGSKPKHGYSKHPIYMVWAGIKRRCYDKDRHEYENYGGRGIKMCEEWLDPKAFCDWALCNGYKKGLTIDRLNNDGDYEPSNCVWITNVENLGIGKKRMSKYNKSGFNGVYWFKRDETWGANAIKDGKRIYLGRYKTPEAAAEARIKWEIETFGEQKTNLHYKVSGL